MDTKEVLALLDGMEIPTEVRDYILHKEEAEVHRQVIYIVGLGSHTGLRTAMIIRALEVLAKCSSEVILVGGSRVVSFGERAHPNVSRLLAEHKVIFGIQKLADVDFPTYERFPRKRNLDFKNRGKGMKIKKQFPSKSQRR